MLSIFIYFIIEVAILYQQFFLF